MSNANFKQILHNTNIYKGVTPLPSMEKQEKMYAIAYSKRPNSMIGTLFKDRETAKKYLPLYKKKGWVGGIVKVDAPKPLTKEEKEDLAEASKFLKAITGAMR